MKPVPAPRWVVPLSVVLILWAATAGLAQAQSSRTAPQILGVGASACLNVGDRVTVKGTNFGRAGGKALVLKDANSRVALTVSSWSDRHIVATVPKSKDLSPGGWYQLGIEDRRGNQIAAERRLLQICGPRPATVDAAGNPIDPDRRTATVERRPAEPPKPVRPGTVTPAGPSVRQAPEAVPPGLPVPPAPLGDAGIDREDDEVLAVTGSLDQATALTQQLGGLGYAVRTLQDLQALGFVLIRLGIPNGLDVPTALANLRQGFPATTFDANTLYSPQAAAEPRTYAKALVGWPEPTGSCRQDVEIGLVDTAVDPRHPALHGRSVTARSFLAAGLRAAPADHGTAIAALIIGDPASTTAGLLPSARLYAAAIFGLRANGRVVGTTDAIARAVDWLGQQGVRIVNLSLSGSSNLVLRLAVERAHEAGMVLVAAAGNEGPNAAPVFPAGYPPVVAVTAIDAALQPYRQANRGDYIDLAAPGVDVWSARGGQGGGYNSGTSFAAPFVAAAAALMLAAQPDITPSAASQALIDKARDLGSPGRDSTFGWGLLQPPQDC
ncbi:S8 family serine peptidase [Pelagibius sp.]|uniref:S8 family serine peptidase n=1 Tax=Pelagibius sp. TaxID=1931238 RepID=UPI002637D352|nr:S8 family serine peptidase [Pelagibius sp.]